MNKATMEAIENANAYLNNVDIPNYSEMLVALEGATETLATLVKLNRIPASNKSLLDAQSIINRVKT